ncbi:MAG TPA: Ig-like domain-containing protein [Frankiaceae bacterium]|nr:Ig-like domain-containing protein [Frankiaceae bacterium]
MTAIRTVGRAAVPLLAAAQLLVVAPPPAHAGAVPWRFTTKVTATFNVAASTIGTGVVECPASYVPIGGGLQTVGTVGSALAPEYERVAEYWDRARGYRVLLHNYFTSAAISGIIAVSCALEAHVGTLEVASADFARSGTFAGGTVTCTTGKVAIGGGADWNTGGVNTRRIDFTSPTPDGTGFYATGESPVAVSLHVEAYCVPAADIGVSPNVWRQDYAGATDAFGSHQCTSGRHVGAAGVMGSAAGTNDPDPFTYRGHSHYSYPSTASSWSSKSRVEAGTRLTSVTWCLPASVPVVTITQQPVANTTDPTPTFTYTATDPAGEAMQTHCFVDEGVYSYEDCPNGSPFTFQTLPDGTHTFVVSVINVSGQRTEKSYTWTVDTTPPTATGPAAGASVSGPLTVTFSEAVTGVSTSSVQVRVAGQTATVPGTVTSQAGGTKAAFVPSSPLVPGETYAVTVTSAIKDLAGNALTANLFLVRTSGVVQNTSAALREFWDSDSSASASGGSYAVSNAAGSSATWRVTATSGQTAALYGTRMPSGGYGEVWVDGVKKSTVSFYRSATAYKVKLFTTPPLSAGTHTIQVRALGTRPSAASGAYVAPDYLQVGLSVLQETAARQAFRRVSAASASGGSYDVVTHKTSGDTGGTPSYSLTFKGTGVRLYVTRWPGAGPARIYVDGVLKKTVTLTSASTLYKQAAYGVTGLSDGRHTIKVVCVGTSSGSASGVAVDYLSVT